EVGAPRKPYFRAVGEGVQRVVLIELHAAGAQPENEFRFEPWRQQERRERGLGRKKGIDQIGTFAQKKPPQSRERSERVPTARLSEREDTRAAAAEQRFERPIGVEHDDRHVVSAPREPCGKHGELALTAADAQVADEK